MRRFWLLLDVLLVFLFAAVLIKPLFQSKYLNRWESIESTFIADGRFLNEHLPHPQWQPLWYCGTRYDYLYPPALRYGTALLSKIWLPVKAYHVYTGLLYCLGAAGVYFLVWVMSRSRAAAWLAALASLLVSPVFLFIPWRSPFWTPWKLWVLLGSGEGPHISSLALLPIALAFTWLALEKSRPACLAAAATFSALVALTNFYGAAALAVFYPTLVWSIWVCHRNPRIWLRAAAIPALAYGLSAFWLVPSYLRITLDNLHYVSARGDTRSAVLLAIAVLLFAAVSFWAGAAKPGRAYPVFLSGALLIFGLNVWGHFHDFRVIGEAHRLASEFDLVIILAAVEVLRRLWIVRLSRPAVAKSLVILAIIASLWGSRHYVRHAWELYPSEPDYRSRVEYQMSEWMSAHLPQARTFVTGSVRFWWDTWHDLVEVGGGSEQGILNRNVVPAQWEITLGPKPELAVRWLTALGADAVIVSGKQSQEIYHDFTFPDKFAGVLPVLYDDHHGDVIYQVPRRYPSLARVVDRQRFQTLLPLEKSNLDRLTSYVAAIEEGPASPATAAWNGTGAMSIQAHLESGQSILLQVTYDSAWHAYAGSRELPVRPDQSAGFILIDAPPGDQGIRLIFETPFENRIGWVLTVLSLLAAAFLLGAGLRPAPPYKQRTVLCGLHFSAVSSQSL